MGRLESSARFQLELTASSQPEVVVLQWPSYKRDGRTMGFNPGEYPHPIAKHLSIVFVFLIRWSPSSQQRLSVTCGSFLEQATSGNMVGCDNIPHRIDHIDNILVRHFRVERE